MCGIAGIVTWGRQAAARDEVERMISAIAHRGPDDAGVWLDAAPGVALGHRRLAIIDLSAQGHQPMHSESGRLVITYNGEIYNHEQVRSELDAEHLSPVWRGHSDTEVLLAAIEAWGIERALSKCVGMFAFALWDREKRSLTLARDRLGEKPLYYGMVDGRLLFASELSAIKAVADSRLEIDRAALARFMQFSYIPAPETIFRGIRKLLPGRFKIVTGIDDVAGEGTPYWQLRGDYLENRRKDLDSSSDEDLIAQVHDRIAEAVKLQMVSDVPLGAFLSGGVDSSLVVSLMQAQSSRKVRTFTIGFEERQFDEAPYAREVARHLGTDHTELYVTSRDALDLIPQLPQVYNEPLADSSQVPTTLVSRLTRSHVTVSLSGDGGDELFAGYPRYGLTERLWGRIGRVPLPLRRASAAMLRSASPAQWDALLSHIVSVDSFQQINGRRMHRLAQLLTTHELGEMYVRLMSQWAPADGLVLQCPDMPLRSPGAWPEEAIDPIFAMRVWDAKQYLPDDLLVKVDRAAMSTSLETRAPLLDHRLVELAFALPKRALVRDGVGKFILRQVLDQYVPRALIERPKAGFAIPIGQWLRGPLKQWAEDLLNPVRLASDGFLDVEKVSAMWAEHKSGHYDRSGYLWNILMFNGWMDEQRSHRNK